MGSKIKSMNKNQTLALNLIALSFMIGIYFYPSMPNLMASHWNIQGQVDGYLSRFWGLFLMPIISTVLFAFFVLIPKIDPLKENIEKFKTYYERFVLLILGFLLYLYLFTILWNQGVKLPIITFLIPSFAILFYYLGVLLEHAKQNWFIGIRTPWTLSNNTVWDKTHKVGAKLFKVAGVISLLGLVFSQLAFFFVLVPVILFATYLVVYSYSEFKRLKL